MIEVHDKLYVGDDGACATFTSSGKAVVHACETCHRERLGYSGDLPMDDPHYAVLEEGRDLYLNLVDVSQTLRSASADMLVRAMFNFVDVHLLTGEVLIHCNLGVSRSPSLAMVYLASRGLISNDSYDSAYAAFVLRYPDFVASLGVKRYLADNWDEIMSL